MNAPGRSWRQHWPMPSQPRPIMIIGTGGIVKDAHLPAYRKAGFTVAGLYDHDRARAEALASEWGIDTVFDTLEQAAAADAAFDVAAPPVAHVHRSAARRVGKDCVSQLRSWWSPVH